ncbi:uncharacterized protein LOC113146568 [Cyclospora cayetanensis]|uniref:Uncharacterized protein LOC113146568 n=1 Tax=Cyclospora cayetanensis TaxID=88456 RepID=A0A6P6RRF3_9EIME|nr:uncharacterized protein LOC113146568 [Cyclospora cayetanensis]
MDVSRLVENMDAMSCLLKRRGAAKEVQDALEAIPELLRRLRGVSSEMNALMRRRREAARAPPHEQQQQQPEPTQPSSAASSKAEEESLDARCREVAAQRRELQEQLQQRLLLLPNGLDARVLYPTFFLLLCTLPLLLSLPY